MWVSTYTRALQRQLDRESWPGSFPTRRERRAKVVMRKGRENYLCLLNFEDAMQGGLPRRAGDALAQLDRALGGLRATATWSAAICPAGCPSLFGRAGSDGADRPARRMRLCRLPALPPMLHRDDRSARAGARRHRHRQSCAGDDPGGARPRSTRGHRRRAMCSTRAIICSMPPTALSPPR